jgi:hypothetical protein
LIGKWLKAGLLEDGTYSVPAAGSPQGGVISPLLAHVYLHYVLDVWFEAEVQPRLRGRAFLIRYADHFVLGFAKAADARRVLDALPKRFGKYGLTLHAEKTRLVDFRSPGQADRTAALGVAQARSFDLLGFTHVWGRSRKENWVVKRRTAPSRFRRALTTIGRWLRFHRHYPVAAQHQTLGQKLRGHFAYYGITGNGEALRRFRDAVTRLWRKWLMRRKRHGYIPWDRFLRLLARYPLPPPGRSTPCAVSWANPRLTSRMP